MATSKKQPKRKATKKVTAKAKSTGGNRGKTAVTGTRKTTPPERKLKKATPKKKAPSHAQKGKVPARGADEVSVPIVGIGASAGGLQAFEEFFRHLPADPGMAFVLVSHLDPHHASILHELLRKSTSLAVEQATDGVAIEANHVYVGPPGKDVAIMNGALQLMEPTELHGIRLPIDYSFRSLAQDQKEKAIGIILSGNGSDGTLGIKAIKEKSGMVMAQDPVWAKFTGMPSSAIATGLVDYVLSPREMPEQLLKYARGSYPKEAKPDIGAADTFPATMQKIFVLLRVLTGHDFSSYKASTLRRRIARRMNIHQIKGNRHYLRYLEENPQEVDLLFKELLIGVTNFFRDADAFDALAKKGLPNLLAAKTEEGALRVWVPGCSTGEEAFSMAILLREMMARMKKYFDLQVFGTDLDAHAIETARIGLYPDGIATDVKADRLKRFFAREDDHYRIKKEIRETVIFAEQDLIRDPPFTKLDLLCCRNLLIYLQADLQKRLLPLFHYALKPGGLLFLGTSETIGGFSDLFQPVDKKWKIFRRKEGASVYVGADFPTRRAPDDVADMDEPSPVPSQGRPNIAQLSSRLLSERYAPPSVIVNERGDIVYIHGQTGLYLQPAPGQPNYNIHSMAREGVRIELAAAIRKATSGDEEVVLKGVQVKANGGRVQFDLSVGKITSPDSLRGLLVVTFGPATEIPPSLPPKKRGRRTEKKRSKEESALERELQYTKENLRGTIEELETANEELKSTNEELQSTNEELQSTNEELETSKEEMQSLNEELQTVNAELQGKIEDLSRANDDMTNLLNATDVATLFLDNDLRIKRFTTQTTKVIRLIASDVGRPIADIASRLEYGDLQKDAAQVLKTLAFKETEVQTEDGTCYLMRIMPYRTATNAINGLVITFVNISILKQAEKDLAQALVLVQNTVDAVREPLLVLGADLRIKSANRSFYRTFQVTTEETEGCLIYELGNHQWDIPELRTLLTEILPEHVTIEDFKVEQDFESIGRRTMLLNARRIEREHGKHEFILLAIEDITDPKQARRDVRESEGG